MRLTSIVTLCIALSIPAVSRAQDASQRTFLNNGAVSGAALGAGSAILMVSTMRSWCDRGCEDSLTRGGMTMAVTGTALIGAAVGWLADRDADRSGIAGGRAHLRIGPTFSWYQSAAAEGSTQVAGLSTTLEASPHVRFTTEYGHSTGAIGASLAQTIGVRVPVWKQVGVELVGGIVGQQVQDHAPRVRGIYGGDVTLAVARHFVIAPGVRVTGGGGARNLSTGLALQYRF